MIKRSLQPLIEKNMFKGKAIIVYGPRRSGKTTLVKEIAKNYEHTYLSCDEDYVVDALKPTSARELKSFIGNKPLVILDEAQKVPDIGTVLKILVDAYPEMQLIVTGSSSLDLANKTKEPLTGRTREYVLYPLSISEVASSGIEAQAEMRRLMRYGGYPATNAMTNQEAEVEVSLIANQYLYKDTFDLIEINNKPVIDKLVRLIAHQIGSDLSLHEIAQQLEISRPTVDRYLYILEQAFIIFHLESYSSNLRDEIKKNRKYYFWDLGVRNAIVKNFNLVDDRTDKGALFENYCVAERYKQNQYSEYSPANYFWRNYQDQEVDYLEVYSGGISAYEFKWQDGKTKGLNALKKTYDLKASELITHRNVHSQFLLQQ